MCLSSNSPRLAGRIRFALQTFFAKLHSGVRPSSGAAIAGKSELEQVSTSSAYAMVAAPEDGRTPGLALWSRSRLLLALAMVVALAATPASAVILWSFPRATLAHETGTGQDILAGALKRDAAASDTLYLKFRINPLSDASTEEYFAALEFFEGDVERLAIGNALPAWAYSVFFNTVEKSETNQPGRYIDLKSSLPEPPADGNAFTYQNPHRGTPVTIVAKIQYVADGDDLVTVWLNPDLGPGASEILQAESLTTRFSANASFDEIRLRHGGRGEGWVFSDIALATSFSDFVDTSSANVGVAAGVPARNSLRFDFRSWQREQGLPFRPVRALTQTTDGYLWLAGDDGLARFDGLRFTSFPLKHATPMPAVEVLFGDTQGALWIGTTNGLYRWLHGEMLALTERDGLPSASILSLAEDNEGMLWIGTQKGLAFWQNGRVQKNDSAELFKDKPVQALCKDDHGTMWLGITGLGLFEFSHQKFSPCVDDSVKDLLTEPHCVLVDHTGRLWVGAGSDSVLCLDSSKWRKHKLSGKGKKSYVHGFAEEADGTIWAGLGEGGLAQFRLGKFELLPPNSRLAGNSVECVVSDHNGGVWAGTEAGLNQLRRKTLFNLGQDEGLGAGPVRCLVEVSPGIIWAGKPREGLFRWDGKIFTRLETAALSGLDIEVNGVLLARDGSCWVASTNAVLRYKDSRAASDEAMQFPLLGVNVVALAENARGELWAGTDSGQVWQLREGQWFGMTNLWQTNPITALLFAADDSLWLGTQGSGLFCARNGGIQPIAQSQFGRETINTIYLDGQGQLWLGTTSMGLCRWRHDHLEQFGTRQGLPDNCVSQILEDSSANFWVGTKAGIARISRKEFDSAASGGTPVLHPRLYGKAEGMASEECANGGAASAIKSSAGLLWFATTKGVVAIDPQTQPSQSVPPQALLEEVLADETPIISLAPPQLMSIHDRENGIASAIKPVRVKPGTHRLEFRFTAINFDAPEQIRFRYRLKGLESAWHEAGNSRSVSYNYVPPGDYEFRVSASTGKDMWSESAATLPLLVQRHFWTSWWFVAMAALSSLFLVGTSARIVEKRKMQTRLKRLEQERALDRERTRIAHDLHDEMGAKLCRISFLSEHARRGNLGPEEMQNQIVSISDASREVLHSLDEIVWAVNPKNDTLEHVASYLGQYMQEYFQMTGISCELDIPPEVPAYPLTSQTRHHLFLAVHEAFTNILKHSAATTAKVSLSCHDGRCKITVSDNGHGFEIAGDKRPLNGDANSHSNGLRNMRERLAAIGGTCELESRPSAGTTVRLDLPLKQTTSQPLHS